MAVEIHYYAKNQDGARVHSEQFCYNIVDRAHQSPLKLSNFSWIPQYPEGNFLKGRLMGPLEHSLPHILGLFELWHYSMKPLQITLLKCSTISYKIVLPIVLNQRLCMCKLIFARVEREKNHGLPGNSEWVECLWSGSGRRLTDRPYRKRYRWEVHVSVSLLARQWCSHTEHWMTCTQN